MILTKFLIQPYQKGRITSAKQHNAIGFTLIEMAVVVSVIGTLTAITAPGWLTFFEVRKLNTAQDQAFQTIRLAQSEAKRSHIVRQANFREMNGTVQWSTSLANAAPTAAEWHNFPDGIQIDAQETTLSMSGGMYKVQFDEMGNINGQMGRLTLKSRNGSRARRCVITSTLIGAIRKGEEHSRPDQSGRICY